MRLAWVIVACLAWLWPMRPAVAATPQRALVLEVQGAIGPATVDYIERGLARAGAEADRLAVIELDTPGGLEASTRAIVQAILAAPVPVAVYVTPAGARAASAGTYLFYAGHIAAMAPGTNVGAATPVALGVPPPGGGENGAGAATAPTASERKAINDSVAFLRSLGELRGRNVAWAEVAVREGASLSARAAVAQGVADFIARDLGDLLRQAHGRKVLVRRAVVTLATRDLAIERVAPDWRTRFLATITDPNIALILVMIGVYGLVFELMIPGTVVPGTIGAISLLLGFYALAVLPVDYTALGLILLGLALMVAEAFAPSFGILGLGGLAAFILGAAILMDTGAPGFMLAWPVVVGAAVASLGFSLLVVRLAWRSRQVPIVTGREEMIGAEAQVQDWHGKQGHVFIRGERWRAVASTRFARGDVVRVKTVRNLVLEVE